MVETAAWQDGQEPHNSTALLIQQRSPAALALPSHAGRQRAELEQLRVGTHKLQHLREVKGGGKDGAVIEVRMGRSPRSARGQHQTQLPAHQCPLPSNCLTSPVYLFGGPLWMGAELPKLHKHDAAGCRWMNKTCCE